MTVTPEDRAAIARANDLFARQRAHRWTVARTGARERRAKLRRLRDAVLARREALGQAIAADFGRPVLESEVVELVPFLLEAREAIRRVGQWMRPRRVAPSLVTLGTRSEIHYVPRGTCLILNPWNYPFMVAATALVSAIAAGNCVLLRPSEKTPATGAFLDRLVRDLFPEDEVAVVLGGVPVAQALLDLPFDHFFFTGSTEVGRIVGAAAARHLASVTLELGGKCPAIVGPTADLDRAAERLVWGAFLNAGQTCVAPDHVFVHASVEAALLERLAAVIGRFYPAAADGSVPDQAGIIDQAARTRLAALRDASVAAGARLLAGGQDTATSGQIRPGLLAGVRPDMAIMQEEVFGPLLPVLTYDDLEHPLAAIRNGATPLALYVFSGDDREIRRVLQSTASGGAVVNGVILQWGNPGLPLGGLGASGVGAYHGHAGFLAFSHQRAVVTDSRLNLILPSFFPPYTPRVRRLLRLARWFLGRG